MGVIEAITSVWTSLATWFTTTIPSLLAIFWTPGSGDTAGSLTFMGVLAVAALGVGVFFLIVGLIQNFLHFRA